MSKLKSSSKGIILIFLPLVTTVLLFQNCQGQYVLNEVSNEESNELSGFAKLTIAQKSGSENNSLSIVHANNVYSPSLVAFKNKLLMYYGGWYYDDQYHDNLYLAECNRSTGQCSEPITIVDSMASGFEHLNDPAVVKRKDGSLIMYVTGVVKGLDGLVPGNNSVYALTSIDSKTWSAPKMVAPDIWMPGATSNALGQILLIGNHNASGDIIMYNLGAEGLQASGRTVLSRGIDYPKFYINPEINYRRDLKRFQIFAEVMGDGTAPNQIDHLESIDGKKWTMKEDGFIKPRDGNITVRTPATHPTRKNVIYYAETVDPASMQNKIRAALINGTQGLAPGSRSPQSVPGVPKLVRAEAKATLGGWTVNKILDSNRATSYSSPLSNRYNSEGLYVAAWFKDQSQIQHLVLNSRMNGAQSLGFPVSYKIYLTDPNNTRWDLIGTFSNQPDSTGQVVIALANAKVPTLGVMIVPVEMGKDNFDNHYFQLADIQLK
jgi:hypothetical protein